MGICCMVLTDDGSAGEETEVEGKESSAVFKGHPAESRLVSKKKKKRKMGQQIGEKVAIKGRLIAKNCYQVC